MGDCKKVAPILPESLRRQLWHFTGNAALNNVIWEEHDVVHAHAQLVRQRSEALQYLKTWAAKEDHDVSAAINGLVANQSEVIKVESEWNGAHEQYIETLGRILRETKATSKLEKKAAKAAKRLGKVETKLAKAQAAARNPDNKPNFDQAAADAKVLKAQEQVDAEKATVEKARSDRDSRMLEVKNFKNETIKEALVGYVEATVTMHERAAQVMRAQLALAKAIPVNLVSLPGADVKLIAPAASPAALACAFVLKEKAVRFERRTQGDRIALEFKDTEEAVGTKAMLRWIEEKFADRQSFTAHVPLRDLNATFGMVEALEQTFAEFEKNRTPEAQTSLSDKLSAALHELEHEMGQQGHAGHFFFAGHNPSLIDAYLGALLVRLPALKFSRGYVVPEDLRRIPALVTALKQRNAFRTLAPVDAGKQLRPLSHVHLVLTAMQNAVETLDQELATLDEEAPDPEIAAKVLSHWSEIEPVVADRGNWLPVFHSALEPHTPDVSRGAKKLLEQEPTSEALDAFASLAQEPDTLAVRRAKAALKRFQMSLKLQAKLYTAEVRPVMLAQMKASTSRSVLVEMISNTQTAKSVPFVLKHLDTQHRWQFLQNLRAVLSVSEWADITAVSQAALSPADWKALSDLGFRDVRQASQASIAPAPAPASAAAGTEVTAPAAAAVKETKKSEGRDAVPSPKPAPVQTRPEQVTPQVGS